MAYQRASGTSKGDLWSENLGCKLFEFVDRFDVLERFFFEWSTTI